MLSQLVGWLRKNFGYRVLLGTHHAGSTIPVLERSRIEFDGYITLINKLGVMMFPTQEMALKAIRSAKKPVIAIKPLAGGRIPPRIALEFLYKDVRIDVCMIGVASESEVDEDIPLVFEKVST